MAYVIGLDFGNCNSFPCYIPDINEQSRQGGVALDLLENERHYGIPSVFFYSARIAEQDNALPLPWVCDDAVRLKARPLSNQKRFLKRHLGETMTIDGKVFSCDEAITLIIQYIVRNANKILKEKTQRTTNEISLSYPVTYTEAQMEHLIKLAEKATLEDGTHLHVYGTITEPAAAALDYLYENPGSKEITTVLTYDLGGGTFDAALVAAYPKGRKSATGDTFYYDLLDWGGLEKLGGKEFDDAMFDILISKAPSEISEAQKNTLRNIAEATKIELSRNEEASPSYYDFTLEEDIELTVTRREFEEKTMPLVEKTIMELQKLVNKSTNPKPDMILLTGGASLMPMVQREVKKAFPDYPVIIHRPSRAIAYGAARFATIGKVVQRRITRDLGIRCYLNEEDPVGYITTVVREGDPFPLKSQDVRLYTASQTNDVLVSVYEANKSNPSEHELYADYRYIMETKLTFNKRVEEDHPITARFIIDERGLLTLEAEDAEDPTATATETHELKNLSTQ